MPKDLTITTPITKLSNNHVYIKRREQNFLAPPSSDSEVIFHWQLGNLTAGVYVADESPESNGIMTFTSAQVSASLSNVDTLNPEKLGAANDRVLTEALRAQLVADGVIDEGTPV